MGISETIGYYVNQWWFPFALGVVLLPICVLLLWVLWPLYEKLEDWSYNRGR